MHTYYIKNEAAKIYFYNSNEFYYINSIFNGDQLNIYVPPNRKLVWYNAQQAFEFKYIDSNYFYIGNHVEEIFYDENDKIYKMGKKTDVSFSEFKIVKV